MNAAPPTNRILSRHAFTRPRIRTWLPILMLSVVLVCAAVIPPRIRVYEIVGLILLLYVAVSTVVSVCEITVVEGGLIISRLLLPAKYAPWDAIDRVLVLSHENSSSGVQIEITTIGFYEGLSPLNRLPGLVYGQGFRQTIVVLRDAVEDYDALMETLRTHCVVVQAQARP